MCISRDFASFFILYVTYTLTALLYFASDRKAQGAYQAHLRSGVRLLPACVQHVLFLRHAPRQRASVAYLLHRPATLNCAIGSTFMLASSLHAGVGLRTPLALAGARGDRCLCERK